jgi:hypothetical protein
MNEDEILETTTNAAADSFDPTNATVNSIQNEILPSVTQEILSNDRVPVSLPIDLWQSVLENSTKEIVQSIEASSSFSFYLVCASAIVAAAAAFLFNLLNWLIDNRLRAKISIRDKLLSQLQELESTAIDYWLSEPGELDEKASKKMEIQLKAKLQQIRTQSHLLESYLYFWQRDQKQSLTIFLNEIYDDVTGAEFESSTRVSNPSIATRVSTKCSKISAIIATAIR